jgi:hypothetical protein
VSSDGISALLVAKTKARHFAKIIGWSSTTMVRMGARHGHFALEELRSAVKSISALEIRWPRKLLASCQGTVVIAPASGAEKARQLTYVRGENSS